MTNSLNSADIWIGDLSPEELEQYVEDAFNEEGEAIASKFRSEFSLPWLDHDFVESHSVAKKGESIFSVFDGFSFSGSYKAEVLKRSIELGIQNSRCAIVCFSVSNFISQPGNMTKMKYLGRFQAES